MDPVQFPLLGNSRILALVILIHVFGAFFAVGALALSVAAEFWSRKKNDPHYLRLAQSLSRFLSDMMKVNGVLGVAIIVLTIGLWNSFAAFLYSVHFWTFLAEGAAFLLLMSFSIAYHNTWHSASPRRHLLLGIAATASALAAAFLINAIWAFMLTPGKWLQSHSRLDAFLTPILPESSLHLLLPCLINAALLLFLYTFFKSRQTSPDQPYFQKMNAFSAKIAAALLLLQPLSGISFLFKLKSATENLPSPNPWQQLSLGMARPFLIAMIALASLACLCALLYWALGHQKGRPALLLASLAMFLAFPAGAFTRERARKPYLIWNTLAMNQQFIPPPTATNTTASNPASPNLTPNLAAALDGKKIFTANQCQACHSFQGQGASLGPALDHLKPKFDRPKLIELLRNPPESLRLFMPPFTGTPQDLDALASYLLP